MNPLLAIVLREKGSQAVVVIGVRPRDPQIVTAWLMLQAVILIPAQGQILEDDEIAFLREHAPRVLEIAKEAERENYREVLEEVKERVEELQGEWEEAKGDGVSWAKLMVGQMANETALEFLVWKFEEEKIVEAAAEGQLRTLMEEQLKIYNGIARQEIAWAKKEGEKEEAAELGEELEWRMKNPGRAVDELVGEFLREREEGEEEEDEEPGKDEPEGEVYTPPPARKEITSELVGVTYDYDQHIVTTLETYCFDCHDKATAKGDLDLETALAEKPLVRNRLLWENVAERVKNGDMPPAKKAQPKERDRLRVRAWLAREIDHFDYSTVRNPGYLPARRLTREEYNRTIRDLVGLDLRPADQFPMDFSGTSGFSNSANTLFLATAHLDRYLTSAELVIDAVRKDAKAWRGLIKKVPAGEALEGFVRRAYRRPPSKKEMFEVRERFARAKKAGKSEQEALAEVFKVVLISPHFLLRVEEGGEAGVDVAVGPFDYATRLSYFLWASTPDSELLSAAARGELSSATQRNEFISAMLADPRSRALGEIFAGEWLGTHNVGPRIRKDPIDNPWCTESLMAAMRNETAYFVHSLILENAPVARLIDAEYTYLNNELARFYKISGVQGDEMQRVRLETNQRGGVLGHASVLAATSFPERTSPVVRGTWILTTLLGTPPPPPPPDVPEIEVEGRSRKAVRTLRQKLERHRESKKCAGCHSQIDPLGFALENYAEFGQWRGGVDNHGTLPNGAKFRGPAGLKIALKETRLDDLGTQVIRKMLAYGLGRQLEYYDESVAREIAAKLKPAGYPLGEMVREIASSYPFTTKRLPGKPKSNKPANQ
jgi:hypothetical protein